MAGGAPEAVAFGVAEPPPAGGLEQPNAASNSVPVTINNPIFLMLFILEEPPFFIMRIVPIDAPPHSLEHWTKVQ